MTVRNVLILLESFLGKQSKEQNTGIIGAILSKIYLVSYNSHDYKVIQNGKGQGTAPLKYLPYVRIQLDFQQNMDHKFVQLLQIIQGGKFSQLWNSTVDSLDTFVVPWVHSNCLMQTCTNYFTGKYPGCQSICKGHKAFYLKRFSIYSSTVGQRKELPERKLDEKKATQSHL